MLRGKLVVAANRILICVLMTVAGYQYGNTRESVISRFHTLLYDSPDSWQRNKWLNILTLQNPNDAWITQELISRVKPDFIVETGTFHGGSALLWASILEHVNPEGKVLTVDVSDICQEARTIPLFERRVEFFQGSSTDPVIFDQIKSKVAGKKVMVILDSMHLKDHVLKELEMYSVLVNVGSYVLVQDTNVNGHPVLPEFGPGPMEAVQAFLAVNHDFMVDGSCDRLLLTFHPSGCLKKVK